MYLISPKTSTIIKPIAYILSFCYTHNDKVQPEPFEYKDLKAFDLNMPEWNLS